MIARRAAARHGWTNSQPLDKLDGYDLLTKTGQRLLFAALKGHNPFLAVIAFDCRIWSLLTNSSPGADWERLRQTIGRGVLRLVVAVAQHRFQRGRCFPVEQPVGALSWTYRGIIAQLLVEPEVFYAVGAQCRFMKRDIDSQKPIQRLTGYLTNCQPVLNQIALPRLCPAGSHEQTRSSNSQGKRSAQAAAYPVAMADAICRGAKRQMVLDYVAAHGNDGAAYPVRDAEEAGLEEAAGPPRRRRVGPIFGEPRATRKRGRPVRDPQLRAGRWNEC